MGMPVTSHELYPAVAYGADGVEHIRGTSRRGYSPKISGLSRSYRDVIDLLIASKMTLTPTIGIQGGFRLQTLRDPSWIDDPRIQTLYPPSVWQRWRDQTPPPASAAMIEEAAGSSRGMSARYQIVTAAVASRRQRFPINPSASAWVELSIRSRSEPSRSAHRDDRSAEAMVRRGSGEHRPGSSRSRRVDRQPVANIRISACEAAASRTGRCSRSRALRALSRPVSGSPKGRWELGTISKPLRVLLVAVLLARLTAGSARRSGVLAFGAPSGVRPGAPVFS